MSSICRKCTSEVRANQNGVACDMCSVWFHAKCVGISGEAYKYLKASFCSTDQSSDSQMPTNGGVLWFCQDCIAPASKLIKNISTIQQRQDELDNEMTKSKIRQSAIEGEVNENKRILDNLHKNMSSMSDQLKEIQTELASKHDVPNQWSDIVSQAVDDKLERVVVEISEVEKTINDTRKKAIEVKDTEDRSTNIILYRVPECPPGNYEEIIKHDTDFCIDMCRDVFGLDVQNDDVSRVYRLGKRGQSPRPVLIRLSSRLLKNRIMESAFRLRNAEDKYKGVIIAHDMTKQQREECKKLVKEAKDSESQEPSGEYIFRVRGAPEEMKIVKIRKRQQQQQ